MKGGKIMVLTLYHDEKQPHKVYNCIKVSVDNQQTVVATVKDDAELFNRRFSIEKDYQRLVIQID